MDLIKITPDKDKAKSIVRMTSLIEERIKKCNRREMAALIITDYYEIIKELIISIILVNGYKTLNDKDLIEYIKEKHKEFNPSEITFLEDLRVLKDRISYEGFFVEPSYLERNEEYFRNMIKKLRGIINQSIK
jgi:hypothetical protein